MGKKIRKKIVMTFEDLPLFEAVRNLFDDPEFVRSEALLIESEGREWVLQKIISLLSKEYIGQYRFERMLLAVNQFRKLSKEHLKKRLIVLEHARKMKNPECFYKSKLSTDCSNEVDLDRVKPGKRGGKYTIGNTVLACSKHNRQRGCKEVENYWKQ